MGQHDTIGLEEAEGGRCIRKQMEEMDQSG